MSLFSPPKVHMIPPKTSHIFHRNCGHLFWRHDAAIVRNLLCNWAPWGTRFCPSFSAKIPLFMPLESHFFSAKNSTFFVLRIPLFPCQKFTFLYPKNSPKTRTTFCAKSGSCFGPKCGSCFDSKHGSCFDSKCGPHP